MQASGTGRTTVVKVDGAGVVVDEQVGSLFLCHQHLLKPWRTESCVPRPHLTMMNRTMFAKALIAAVHKLLSHTQSTLPPVL
jgi:hypothetical protein